MDSDFDIRRGYSPGAIGRIVDLHGSYYAAAWGVGAPFEILMARELCEFVEHYRPDKDLLLTAHCGELTVGALAVLGQTSRVDWAQLRFVIVDPRYQGRGAGRALLSEALEWCRSRGFAGVFLWTVDHLPQSRALYERAGFEIVERTTDDRYSTRLDSIKMERRLP